MKPHISLRCASFLTSAPFVLQVSHSSPAGGSEQLFYARKDSKCSLFRTNRVTVVLLLGYVSIKSCLHRCSLRATDYKKNQKRYLYLSVITPVGVLCILSKFVYAEWNTSLHWTSVPIQRPSRTWTTGVLSSVKSSLSSRFRRRSVLQDQWRYARGAAAWSSPNHTDWLFVDQSCSFNEINSFLIDRDSLGSRLLLATHRKTLDLNISCQKRPQRV